MTPVRFTSESGHKQVTAKARKTNNESDTGKEFKYEENAANMKDIGRTTEQMDTRLNHADRGLYKGSGK